MLKLWKDVYSMRHKTSGKCEKQLPNRLYGPFCFIVWRKKDEIKRAAISK